MEDKIEIVAQRMLRLNRPSLSRKIRVSFCLQGRSEYAVQASNL